MRRWVAVGVLGVALFSAAACRGNPTESATPSTAPSSAAPSPSTPPNTEEVCADFKKAIDSARMREVGVPIGELIVYRAANNATKIKEAEGRVTAELTKLSGEVAAVGAKATDPAVKAKFDQVAANIAASAKDLKFLANVKKVSDLEAPFTAELLSWVTPIASTCDLS